jgi:hypothetical protein
MKIIKNILLFSDNLKIWRDFLQFHFIKYWKIFVLIFKWNKNIKLNELSYFREWRFKKSFLIIHFNFKNAVWYQLKSIKRINCLKPIILNLENIKGDKIELIVYGFFRQEKYLIDISTSETLITESFRTEINQINIIHKIVASFDLKLKKPLLEKRVISLEQKKIDIDIKPISFNFKNYTQKEYI